MKHDNFKEDMRICNNIKSCTIDRKRDKYAKSANLKIIRLHDFRHSFISHLYFANIDDEIIKELVGHSTTKMTEKYKHLHPVQKERAKEVLTNMIL